MIDTIYIITIIIRIVLEDSLSGDLRLRSWPPTPAITDRVLFILTRDFTNIIRRLCPCPDRWFITNFKLTINIPLLGYIYLQSLWAITPKATYFKVRIWLQSQPCNQVLNKIYTIINEVIKKFNNNLYTKLDYNHFDEEFLRQSPSVKSFRSASSWPSSQTTSPGGTLKQRILVRPPDLDLSFVEKDKKPQSQKQVSPIW